jgi:molybdenum cofactor cytidylyltransferase
MVMPVGILLAAGRGTRFGGHKLLHPLPDGTPLGVASARALCAALDRVVAVVRADDAELAAALRAAGCETVVCARAEEGMGASLACGVTAARDATGWVIALADMPFIRPATIAAVATTVARGAAIAAPVLPDGQRGHPVGFAASWGEALCALGGDRGARDLLQAHGNELTQIPSADPGCVADVDSLADLAGACGHPSR